MICQEFTTQPLPTHPRFINLTGQVFHRLTVESFAGRITRQSLWNCLCKCGKKTVTEAGRLKNGTAKSCGCLARELSATRRLTHGESRIGQMSPEYMAYDGAKRRCRNPNNKDYFRYGGRGIEFRFDSFDSFLAEVGRKTTPEHSIDRIDNAGHYEINNVRWATRTEQGRNKRNNVILTVKGVTLGILEWVALTGIPKNTIYNRLYRGWCDVCAIKHFIGRGKCPHII